MFFWLGFTSLGLTRCVVFGLVSVLLLTCVRVLWGGCSMDFGFVLLGSFDLLVLFCLPGFVEFGVLDLEFVFRVYDLVF